MIAAFNQFADLPRWVVWLNENRDRHATKVPYSPHSGHAKADGSRTWGARSEANDTAPEDTSGRGQKLAVVDPEPWPDPVDGAALIETLAATIRRYVVLESSAAVAAAL
jgi:hypothetical protein